MSANNDLMFDGRDPVAVVIRQTSRRIGTESAGGSSGNWLPGDSRRS